MSEEARNDANEAEAQESTQSPAEPQAQAAPVAYDAVKILKSIPKILWDPFNAVVAMHAPGGKAALYHGLTLGVGTAVLVPLVQFLTGKIALGRWYSPEFLDILRQMLGGVVFVAVAVVLCFALRSKGEGGKSWMDDVYLVGSVSVFFLAGVIAAGVVYILGPTKLGEVSMALGTAGLLLAAFALHGGLVKIGGATAERSVWIVVIALVGALLVAGLLYYNPIVPTGAGGMAFGAGSYSPNDARDAANEILEGMFKNLPR